RIPAPDRAVAARQRVVEHDLPDAVHEHGLAAGVAEGQAAGARGDVALASHEHQVADRGGADAGAVRGGDSAADEGRLEAHATAVGQVHARVVDAVEVRAGTAGSRIAALHHDGVAGGRDQH